ncbi:LOW QUALITY PROTEIN: polygalacturonase [Flavobacteriaceae bacterium MAR_2009_75]|nr:LOW QUALITY PROTEIN: polygalacturonase [Flavobacteriaceae bacterium MAR_2009_75]
MKYLSVLLIGFLFAFPKQSNSQISVDKDSIISEIERRISLPEIPDYSVSIIRFGAKGDSLTDCKRAFDKALKHLNKKNGGTLIVPSGTYTVNGPIHLISNLNLHLENGAKIRFGDNPEDYLPMVRTSWEGTILYNYSPLVYAMGKSNISITGEGVIDGEGHKTWAEWKPKENADKLLSREFNHSGKPITERKFGEGHFLRPQLIQFFDCKNILLEGVRFEDSPFWCVHLLRSNNITIRAISYDAHNKNNDGIDLEYSSDVLIENVDFNNADDNIAIKAGRDHEGRSNAKTPSENIIIRNNRFKGLHALVIGSEMSAGVRNVFVENNQASGYLKRGIYFKTNSDRGGYIKDIFINNLQLGQVEDALFMTANYHGEGSGSYPSKISDVTISNITCESVSNTGIVIEGFKGSKVENILLDSITIKSAKNGLTLTNTKNIEFNEVVIGEKAGTPSSVK